MKIYWIFSVLELNGKGKLFKSLENKWKYRFYFRFLVYLPSTTLSTIVINIFQNANSVLYENANQIVFENICKLYWFRVKLFCGGKTKWKFDEIVVFKVFHSETNSIFAQPPKTRWAVDCCVQAQHRAHCVLCTILM